MDFKCDELILGKKDADSRALTAVRPCLALLGQSKTYGKERLEAACLRGHLTGANRLHNIRSMLKHGLEEQQLIANERQDPLQDIRHDNVHGEHYFH